MNFKQSIQRVIELNGEKVYSLTEEKAVWKKAYEDNHIITNQRLPELEKILQKQYGNFLFCAYSSEGTLDAFPELAVQVTVNYERYLIELNFEAIETGNIYQNLSIFVVEEEGLTIETYRFDSDEYKPIREACPSIEEIMRSFAEQLPTYRMYFATQTIQLTH